MNYVILKLKTLLQVLGLPKTVCSRLSPKGEMVKNEFK